MSIFLVLELFFAPAVSLRASWYYVLAFVFHVGLAIAPQCFSFQVATNQMYIWCVFSIELRRQAFCFACPCSANLFLIVFRSAFFSSSFGVLALFQTPDLLPLLCYGVNMKEQVTYLLIMHLWKPRNTVIGRFLLSRYSYVCYS